MARNENAWHHGLCSAGPATVVSTHQLSRSQPHLPHQMPLLGPQHGVDDSQYGLLRPQSRCDLQYYQHQHMSPGLTRIFCIPVDTVCGHVASLLPTCLETWSAVISEIFLSQICSSVFRFILFIFLFNNNCQVTLPLNVVFVWTVSSFGFANRKV